MRALARWASLLLVVAVISAPSGSGFATAHRRRGINPNLEPTSVIFWNKRVGVMGGGVVRDHKCERTCAGGQLLRTHDGGATWRVVHKTRRQVTVEDLWLAPTGTAWAEVACPRKRCALLQSTDRGRHWTVISRVKVHSVSFSDDLHGWALRTHFPDHAGGNEHLVVSETDDGGRSWRKLSKPCDHDEDGDIVRIGQDKGWIECGAEPMTQMQKKLVERTTDGGLTWRRRGKVDWDGQLGGLFFHADGVGWRWQHRGLVLRTSNGGRTWRERGHFFDRDCDDVASMWFPNHGRGFAAMHSCDAPRFYALATTWNGGRNWKLVQSWGQRNPS